jgi:hypothetical protein
MDSEKLKNTENALIDMSVESWRFARLFTRLLNNLDAGEGKRYANQLRYFQKKIENNLENGDLKLINVEGQLFDPGMAASALNMDDFESDDELIIDKMVEPIIMDSNGIRKEGTVMLRKAQL